MKETDKLLLTDEEIKAEAVDAGLLDLPENGLVEQEEIDIYKKMLKAQLEKAYEPLIEQARQEGGRQIVDRFENWAAELSLDDTVTTLPISKIIEFLEQELKQKYLKEK